jgi:hypothetical protein
MKSQPPPPPPSRRSRTAQAAPRPSETVPRPDDVAADIKPPTWEHSDDAQREAALKDVVEGAARFTRAVELAKPMGSYRSRPIVLVVLAAVALAVGLYSLTAKPDWVYGPSPAQTRTAQGEAHIRFAMFLIAQRVNAHRIAHNGELPQSLTEVGEDWPTIIYRKVDASNFELRSVDAAAPGITLRNDEDAVAFLGSSRRHLRRQQP